MSSEPTSLAQRAEELLDDVRRGTPGAWERLVRQYERIVRAVALDMGLDDADGEDVFQATWVALYEHVERIRRPGALPAWILSTARRNALHVLRRRREGREVDLDAGPARAAEGRDPLEWASELERSQLVHAALAELAPRCRTLLTRLYIDCATFADTARELGLAEGSVGPIRNRCLAQLLCVLERRGVD